MRTLVVILIATGVMAFSTGNPPTEIQMRHAFENYLANQVAQTIEFIHATGGPSAVEKVKDRRNDAFEIRKFQKIECNQLAEEPSYDCAFSVDIDLANGMMRRAFEGRFYNTFTGLTFAFVESPAQGATAATLSSPISGTP
jgi:hypothetical protein